MYSKDFLTFYQNLFLFRLQFVVCNIPNLFSKITEKAINSSNTSTLVIILLLKSSINGPFAPLELSGFTISIRKDLLITESYNRKHTLPLKWHQKVRWQFLPAFLCKMLLADTLIDIFVYFFFYILHLRYILNRLAFIL